MLESRRSTQTEVLGALPYSANTALLHTDTSLLPTAANARSSWNFHRPGDRHRPGHRHLRPDPAAAAAHADPLPGHPRRRAPRRPGDRDRPDGVRAPALHARVRGRAAPAAAIDTDRVAFAGAYHGWGFHEDGARSGLAAVDPARAHLADRAGPPRPAGSSPGLFRDHDPAHPAHPVQAHLRAPFAPVAGRSRRPARSRPAGPLRGARPPRLAATHDPRQRRVLPRPARGRPGRRPDPDGRQPALARLLLQPDLRVLVLRRRRRAGGGRGRGAQHVRRPARLPRPPRRAGAGPDRQGDVRLARSTASTATTSWRSPSRPTGSTSPSPCTPPTGSPSARASPASVTSRPRAAAPAPRLGAALRGSAPHPRPRHLAVGSPTPGPPPTDPPPGRCPMTSLATAAARTGPTAVAGTRHPGLEPVPPARARRLGRDRAPTLRRCDPPPGRPRGGGPQQPRPRPDLRPRWPAHGHPPPRRVLRPRRSRRPDRLRRGLPHRRLGHRRPAGS